jgi:hypothetical protein
MEKIDGISFDRLSLIVKTALVPIFFQLLGQGFKVNVQTGCSVKELLCNQLGIDEDYLAERIKTIFLNAKVVDDVNSAIVNEGSILALSGAMPGLVGAILRSGGFYAAMRSQISHDKTRSPLPLQGTGKITLKLFNLVVKELGPVFLQKGILIKGHRLHEFIARQFEKLSSACKRCSLDGNSIDLKKLLDIDWKNEHVFLQVKSEQTGEHEI